MAVWYVIFRTLLLLDEMSHEAMILESVKFCNKFRVELKLKFTLK